MSQISSWPFTWFSEKPQPCANKQQNLLWFADMIDKTSCNCVHNIEMALIYASKSIIVHVYQFTLQFSGLPARCIKIQRLLHILAFCFIFRWLWIFSSVDLKVVHMSASLFICTTFAMYIIIFLLKIIFNWYHKLHICVLKDWPKNFFIFFLNYNWQRTSVRGWPLDRLFDLSRSHAGTKTTFVSVICPTGSGNIQKSQKPS